MKPLKNKSLFYALILLASVGNWIASAEAQIGLTCQSVTQITNNNTRDVSPDWEPAGERITFSTFSTVNNVPRSIGMVNSDGTGYQIAANVVGAPWGTFNPRWAPGNTIVSAEHNVYHEYLSFDVSHAPFYRSTYDGNDAAFTRELYIPGGGGGGWMVISDDGSTALWRFSTNGGAGTQQIRRWHPGGLTGQAASSIGVVLQQIYSSSQQYWQTPVAISSDGNYYINSEEIGGGYYNSNLVLRQTSNGALVRMITTGAAPGINAGKPDFSIDGTKIVFHYNIGDGQYDIYVENFAGTERENVTNTPDINETNPTWDPTGTRIAFNIHDGNDEEIHICTLNAVGDTTKPTADSGENQAIHAGDTVFLDGTGSFDDTTATENLLFSWWFDHVPAGSTAILVDEATSMPRFVADMPGDYIMALAVEDEAGNVSDADYVSISSLNSPPMANAGEDQVNIVGDMAYLDGTASSDADGDPLNCTWSIILAPVGSTAGLADANTCTPTLTSDLEGSYEVQLIVNDGFVDSGPDNVTITAISASDFALQNLMEASNFIASLPNGSFDAQGHRNSLTNWISQIINFIQKGQLDQAIVKIDKTLERVDGCENRGTVDPKGEMEFAADWLIICEEQIIVHDILVQVREALTLP